jgi:uncharacterized membrane protein YphA (DoxX/SURF4 family)
LLDRTSEGGTPLNENKFQIGLATVVMLVILRLSLGCHFLYEGVWKIKNTGEFSSEPFLSQAKGPAAPFFYSMLPDIAGRQRLHIEKSVANDGSVTESISGYTYLRAWGELRDRAKRRYGMDEAQAKQAGEVYDEAERVLKAYLKDNFEKIQQYFKSLDAFDSRREGKNIGWPTEQERIWKRQDELRKDVKVWLSDIDAFGVHYQRELWNLLTDEQKARGWIMDSWNPLDWSQMQLIDFAVTYGLTAIGLCLMIGFFSRLACLGGAAFMIFVNLTQPGWPTIYPPAPPVVGHSLLVTKDFIELVALVLLATTKAGRWGGLDFFLYDGICLPLRRRFFGLRDEDDDQ